LAYKFFCKFVVAFGFVDNTDVMLLFRCKKSVICYKATQIAGIA
jgi:hypothetical protein